MKLTKHSKKRIKQRTNFDRRERRVLFRRALDNGKSIQQIENKAVKRYLAPRKGRNNLKVYKGYVFIYSKNKKVLYTMYKLPEELGGVE